MLSLREQSIIQRTKVASRVFVSVGGLLVIASLLVPVYFLGQTEEKLERVFRPLKVAREVVTQENAKIIQKVKTSSSEAEHQALHELYHMNETLLDYYYESSLRTVGTFAAILGLGGFALLGLGLAPRQVLKILDSQITG